MEERHALVLGGARGIGYGIAEVLLELGYRVSLVSRTYQSLKEAAQRLEEKVGQKVPFFVADVGVEKSLRKALVEVSSISAIDIVVVNHGGPVAGDFFSLRLADWDKGYQLILRSVLVVLELVIPSMKQRRWGRILNISSISAKEWVRGLVISSCFRIGLSALVKEVAKQVGEWNILINNLLPGAVDTMRLKSLSLSKPRLVEQLKQNCALKRFASVREIAEVAAFLVSEKNTYITGTDILVDGGTTRAY